MQREKRNTTLICLLEKKKKNTYALNWVDFEAGDSIRRIDLYLYLKYVLE